MEHFHAATRALAVIVSCEHRHKTEKAAQRCRVSRGWGFTRTCTCPKEGKK